MDQSTDTTKCHDRFFEFAKTSDEPSYPPAYPKGKGFPSLWRNPKSGMIRALRSKTGVSESQAQPPKYLGVRGMPSQNGEIQLENRRHYRSHAKRNRLGFPAKGNTRPLLRRGHCGRTRRPDGGRNGNRGKAPCVCDLLDISSAGLRPHYPRCLCKAPRYLCLDRA